MTLIRTIMEVYGGWNGGGKGGDDQGDDDAGGGGGGSTDVRLIGGEWNDASGLRSRIIVAAGGSGSSYYEAGYDGGTVTASQGHGSKAATQTDGFAFGEGESMIGANDSSSGGGGGYYGGCGGSGLYSGGGGSSFISGYTGCNAVRSASDGTHTGSADHYSGLVFTNGQMTAGVQTGNGKIVISIVTE